jgi:hypothetical protein
MSIEAGTASTVRECKSKPYIKKIQGVMFHFIQNPFYSNEFHKKYYS